MAADTPEDAGPYRAACLAGAAAIARVAELEAALAYRRTELADARWQEQIHADNCAKAEAENDRLREGLEDALETARELLCYAPEWAVKKHGYCAEVDAIEAALAGPAPEGGA
jgi:hypothetical protein